MKGTVSAFAFLLSLLFAASTTLATDPGKTGEMKEKAAKEEQATTGATAGTAESKTLAGEHQVISVNHLLGNNIQNTQGEDLGEINNVLIDPSSGQIAYVMVHTGGFFSGDVKVVPFKALNVTEDQIQLDIDKEKFANAPSWSEGQPVAEFDRKSSEFFGVGPYWVE